MMSEVLGGPSSWVHGAQAVMRRETVYSDVDGGRGVENDASCAEQQNRVLSSLMGEAVKICKQEKVSTARSEVVKSKVSDEVVGVRRSCYDQWTSFL